MFEDYLEVDHHEKLLDEVVFDCSLRIYDFKNEMEVDLYTAKRKLLELGQIYPGLTDYAKFTSTETMPLCISTTDMKEPIVLEPLECLDKLSNRYLRAKISFAGCVNDEDHEFTEFSIERTFKKSGAAFYFFFYLYICDLQYRDFCLCLDDQVVFCGDYRLGFKEREHYSLPADQNVAHTYIWRSLAPSIKVTMKYKKVRDYTKLFREEQLLQLQHSHKENDPVVKRGQEIVNSL